MKLDEPARGAIGRLVSAALAAATSLWPAPAAPFSSSEIQKEAQRSQHPGPRQLLNAWWLPTEYFMASAREQGFDAEEAEDVRRVFQDYVVLAVVDAVLEPGQPARFASVADLVGRSRILLDGNPVRVLDQVNPRLAAMAPQLTYILRASLAVLGDGLRLLPVANLDEKGRPILAAAQSGELRLEIRPEAGAEPLAFSWKAPLTSVVGPIACPRGGEALEASWRYCPWHGVELKPGSAARVQEGSATTGGMR